MAVFQTTRRRMERRAKVMKAVNPRLTSFVPFVERDGSIDRPTLIGAVEQGFCVVRWHVDGAEMVEEVGHGRPT